MLHLITGQVTTRNTSTLIKDNVTVTKALNLVSKVRQAFKNRPRIFLFKLQISADDFLVK